MPTPLLILSDSPSSKSGLGRITRELAMQIHEKMGDVYRVGCVGPGCDDSVFMPFPNYALHYMENWVVEELPEIWRTFAGNERGILLVIWDASRLLWLVDPAQYCKPAPKITDQARIEKIANLRTFLINKPFEVWIYGAIDAEGPNGKLSFLIGQVLSKCDRVLAYSEWSARLIERTLNDGKTIEALPHGIDPQVWRPRGRDKARRKFGQLVFETDFSIKPDQFLIGIVATNQPRKDYGTAIQAAAMLLKTHDVLLWIHIDTLERENAWSLSALLVDYGLQNRAIVTHGRLTDEQMTWAYSACDVTFGIGLGEGFGYPVFESLACGIPCIHGNYAGAAEHLPSTYKMEPREFRTEGTFNSQRPVFRAADWAGAALRLKGETASLPPQLDWNNLWPRWEAWLRKDKMYPTHASPEFIKQVLPESAKDDPQSDYRLYIPFVNRPDQMMRALNSVKSLLPNITMIDNSPNSDGIVSADFGLEIVHPTVPLLFFQSMNFMLQDAKRRGCKFYFFLHNDGEVHPGFAIKMLELARAQKGKWGVIFSLYDVFACFNVDLLDGVGLWDRNLPWYFADNDYYRRLKLAGYEVIEAGQGATHEASSTINSDPQRKFENSITFPLWEQYYIRKWGGAPDHETFDVPFNLERQ